MRFDQKGVKEDGTVKHFHTIHIFHAKKKNMEILHCFNICGIKVDQPHTVQLCVYDVGGRVKGVLLGSAILFAPFQTAFS